MSAFVDKMLLELQDPAALQALVAPPGDPAFETVKALLSAVYELPDATLASVESVEVLASEFEHPIFVGERRTGTWTKTNPVTERTDVLYASTNGAAPRWVDVVTDLRVTAVLEVDPGEVESITTHPVDDFTTRAEIKLKPLPPFNPGDPANERRFDLRLAILVRDTIDVGGALRDAKLTVEMIERSVAFTSQVLEADMRSPLAPVVIFPDDALPANVSAAQLRAFFAGERVLALLTAP